MSRDLSQNRLIRNEQLVRERNKGIKNGIKKYFRNNEKVKAAPLVFICECSVKNCQEHVTLSINDYEKIHKRRDRFTVVPGHEKPSIEKVVVTKPDFSIVEKIPLSP